jgi:hypothetical protein
MSSLVKWIVTIYVVSILAWSGLLKAEEIVIDQAQFNADHFQLTLSGRINSTCGLSLKTKIIENQFTEDGSIAVVEIINQGKTSTCPMNQSNEAFDMIVDVRTMGLKPGATYNLAFANTFAGGSSPLFTVSLPQHAFYSGYTASKATGVIYQTLDGQWLLVKSPSEAVKLQTKIDLSRYVGQLVIIEGTEVLHRTGPIYDLSEHSPLRVQTKSEASALYVLSISTVTY